MTAATNVAVDAGRWAAVLRRDPAADGQYVYAVRTTGVYCRPVCPARRPRRENVVFFDDPAAATAAGFRPCKRCGAPEALADIVAACRAMERGVPVAVDARRFRRATGVTPASYAAACRWRRFRLLLRRSATVTAALHAAGFGSAGRCYEMLGRELGMTPTVFRRGGEGEAVAFALADSPVGRVLAAATPRGVCAVMFGEDDAALRAELAGDFPAAVLVEDAGAMADHLTAVVAACERPASPPPLPLDIRGTTFQRQVWEALRRVPAGRTVTYAQLAADAGRPGAARAAGTACGANLLAVLIPCHRAIGADGKLRGFRWGTHRKQWLLDRERTGE